VRYCSYCEDWQLEEHWTEHSIYVHSGNDQVEFYDEDDDLFFDSDCHSSTAWEHDNCNKWFMYSAVEERSTWICGRCETSYTDQDDARNCCS
jgi:hypothetical protein